ncbi:hypothetical protein EC9_43000 [Rosistilla ulvae]|uniref:HTTM-like domain-containing protein n=1 Tax=Rosistilla ulvae TaxID=1930277 RepID=A0A517M5E5_9BACT|nr:HTTM domain-containing protein [Rosistilla ulvae]QDS90096.1 hypothetical protein EC9_43000 [Rosistilla ulvae]
MAQRTAPRLIANVRDRWFAIRDAWQQFWYQPEDPIGVAWLRIATGLVLLYTLAIWSFDLSAFFGSEIGWQSAELVSHIQHGQWTFSFWWWVPDDWLWLAHGAAMLVVAAFTIGLFTRITKFAALLICISYANRVPMVQFGLDQVTAAWLLYLCLGPCGARLSIDRWWSQRNRRRRGLPTAPVALSSAARLTTRMVQVHLCVIYLWAGLSKLQGGSWLSGEAIWWIASNYEHQQVSMTWLAYVPWLYQLLTIGTWAWEISFSFLVWNRSLRWWVLTVGMGMHAGIGLFLGLWPFALIMVVGYVSFVPTAMLVHCSQALRRASGLSRGDRKDLQVERSRIELAFADDERVAPEKSARAAIPSAANEKTDQPSTVKLASVCGSDQDAKDSAAAAVCEPMAAGDARRPAVKPIKKVKMMLGENDRDNMVLFVERSAKRRCSLIRALEANGYRCIGLDAWPETIEVYNVLKPRYVMCNGYKLPTSELRFWRAQLDERPDSVFVVLVEPHQVSQTTSADGRTIGLAIPASFEQIRAALEGVRPPADDGGSLPQAGPTSESDEEPGDNIFSLTSHNRPN